MTDKAEAAYWRFDARRNGYGEWKETPQSERDAFKAEYTDHAALLRAVAGEVGKLPHATFCETNNRPHVFERDCNCPRGKVLAMLEVEND